METFSALLALCAGYSPVTGEFPSQRPVTGNFDVFFDLRPNKRLSKQSWGWCFETPSRPLCRHCNGIPVISWLLICLNNSRAFADNPPISMSSNLVGKLTNSLLDFPSFINFRSWNSTFELKLIWDAIAPLWRHINDNVWHSAWICILRGYGGDDDDAAACYYGYSYYCYHCCYCYYHHYGAFTRYAKLRVAHAPGMPGALSPPPRVSDPDMHHGTCVTHVHWCMPESTTNGFLWSRWRGKRSRHSWRMRNPQFCVSGKRPMATAIVMVVSSLEQKVIGYS